ncbi:hypothetical protein CGCA056_v004233 [Colletotrichum aenigma]|uniref:uncharacterized protein n=1 Tax=Colletotrichum aenigma TaxID=1215731 RepID=UPI001872ADBE|nr:uncharacterized protein CGCA056_v004233 [Colletotrichum aenigma]KAF5523655.1 hypothetical protein CGCA056_v004233 [Colletotrichum aenigma]
MTFLLEYYRLLEVSRLRYVLIGCMVVIFLWGLSQTFVAFLQCIPLEAVWDHTIESKCIKNIAIIWYFNGTFNIVTDFIIITLPIPKIWQLQMPRKISDIFSPNESQISTWIDAPNQDTHASFGDHGVTATVNACGDLMQFSRYLDAGSSGIFCADHTTTNEPYSVQERAEDLLFLSRDKSRQRFTYGLRVLGISMKNCHHLGYVHDRWPRYEVEDKSLKLTIQWMVREKTVLQQCIITNTGETDVDIPMEFCKGLHIRDMDYLDPMDKFNDDWDGHVPVQGPNNYGWVLAHPLKRKGATEEKRPTKDTPMQLMRLGSRKPTNATVDSHKGDMWGYSGNVKLPHAENDDNQDTIAVVISVFVDGRAIRFGTANQKSHEKMVRRIRGGAAIEVVSGYKMVRFTDSRASWEDFVISANVADVSNHLTFASKFFTTFSPCAHEPSHVDHGQRDGETGRDRRRNWISPLPTGPPKGLLEIEDQSVNQSFNHIDFVARRKLEHILSVCAIPLRDPEEEGDIVPVALTCGDTSGHRVSSPASFFAFSFLLEISKRLTAARSKDQYDTYGELRKRIYSVCRGHLKWLNSVEKTDSNCFSANYWVKGNKMSRNEESESFMPIDSLTDTPFQIIKVFEFASQYHGEDELDLARGIIKQVAIPWITALNKSDVRISRAWPHSQDEGCNKYRLSEHVWIWRALKLVEGHFRDFPEDKVSDAEDEKFSGEPSRGQQSKEIRDVTVAQHDQVLTDDSLLRRFDSRDVQRDILRRFTAENEISKKRMLAMTRSPRETRFLFHASDTTLFYGINRDFFSEKTSLNEVWQNTIEAQVHHNENSETGWDNSIRYALAIMLGTRDISINKRPPQELIKSSLEVLFGSTSPNGLLFGLLDSNTKESALFGRENDRDFYFHASFEIPYILLTHCWRIHSKLNTSGTQPEPSSTPQTKVFTTHDLLEEVADLNLMQPKRQPAQTDRIPRLPVGSAPSPEMTETQLGSTLPQPGVKLKATKVVSMKKSIPFNSLIDQSSIVDLDEEWLYNYPTFFSMEKQTSAKFNEEAESLLDRTERDTSGALISRAAEGYTRYLRNGERRNRPAAEARDPGDPLQLLSKTWTDIPSPDGHNALEDESDNMTFIADVLRQRNLQKHERENNVTFRGVNSNFKLWYLLSLPRTASKAKKRFIWLPSADDERALVCYLTSPQEERQAISLFFERHHQYEKHFLDETSMVLNTWESELHLSFYKLVDEDYTPTVGIPRGGVDEFPGREPKLLVKAAVGFRFIGDFFDRHWTCHLIEHIPGGKRVPTWWDREMHERDFPWGDKGHLVQDNNCWRQRKVLELHLFDRILEELVDSTKTIYNTVKEELGVKHVAIPFSVLNSEDYFSSSEQWQRYQQILQVLEEDLSDMRVIISKWETREKDRGQERPRWTRTDERKYRRYIGKLEGTTRRRIRDLHRLHVQIQSLKETLRRGQQQIRDDLNLRGSENIRFFTYVTVVFLPLGFASSIFGMSEEPPSSVIPPMIICSVVALLVTVVALANAKRLNGVVEVISENINRYSLSKMEGSPLLNRHRRKLVKTQNLTRQAEEAGSETSEGHSKGTNIHASRGIRAHEDEQSWHFWFWVGYLFVELPARRVLMAYYDLKHPKFTYWSMYFRLVMGTLLLPIFLISFFFQLVLINTFDAVRSILKEAI